MTVKELQKVFEEYKAATDTALTELKTKLEAAEQRVGSLDAIKADVTELKTKLEADAGPVVHGSVESGLLNLFIDHLQIKADEGAAVPVLRELRKLRGDELEEDMEDETDNTAESGEGE